MCHGVCTVNIRFSVEKSDLMFGCSMKKKRANSKHLLTHLPLRNLERDQSGCLAGNLRSTNASLKKKAHLSVIKTKETQMCVDVDISNALQVPSNGVTPTYLFITRKKGTGTPPTS